MPKDAQLSLQMLAIARYDCALRLDRTPFERAARSRPKNSQALSTARSIADITDNVAYVELDTALFDLMRRPEGIDALSEVLAVRWFDRGLQDLRGVVGRSEDISRYERQLRDGTRLMVNEASPPACVRTPAFRRVVVEIFDYRCAATGSRLLLDSGEAMVEAAHIHPFSEAGDA